MYRSSQEKAERFGAEYGIKKCYGSYEALLVDKKVDLVYIATPHSEHYENAKMCIRHKKPVLCEKAFMANADRPPMRSLSTDMETQSTAIAPFL